MEAYSYYLRGVEDYDKNDYNGARRHLEKAVEIDSTFAMAYLYLSMVYASMQMGINTEIVEKAMRYAGHATERERLYIESFNARVIEEDREKTVRILEDLVRKYPKEKRGYFWLAWQAENESRHEDAIALYKKALALDASFIVALDQMGFIYTYMGEYERALDYYERYVAASPGDPNPLNGIGRIYILMGNLDRAMANVTEAWAVEPKSLLFTTARSFGWTGGLVPCRLRD
jgi:tetratricopeptide (TPR) repeat protein